MFGSVCVMHVCECADPKPPTPPTRARTHTNAWSGVQERMVCAPTRLESSKRSNAALLSAMYEF